MSQKTNKQIVYPNKTQLKLPGPLNFCYSNYQDFTVLDLNLRIYITFNFCSFLDADLFFTEQDFKYQNCYTEVQYIKTGTEITK